MEAYRRVLAMAVLALAACAGTGFAAGAKEPGTRQVVEVSVQVPLQLGEAGARKEATREAVLRVAGVLVPAQAGSVSPLTKDGLHTKARGFARVLRIIQSERQGDAWLYHAEFEVSVPDAAALKEMGLLRDWRVLVIIPEFRGERITPDTATEDEVMTHLVKAGYRVLDSRPSGEKAREELVRLKDAVGAAEFARRRGADVIVTGEVRKRADATGDAFARAEVHAILVETGEIIAADAGTGLRPSQIATRLIRDIRLIGDGNARKLALQVGIFKGFTDADDFEEALKKLPGIVRVTRDDYADGLATFQVEVDPAAAKTLPRLLEKDPSMAPFNLKVKTWSITGGRVEVQHPGRRD